MLEILNVKQVGHELILPLTLTLTLTLTLPYP